MGWFWFSWLTSHARGLFHHLVNNTDTPKVTCERKKITSEPRTSFSRRLSSVRLLFDMASTVLNGSDRSEKWHRPFTKWKLVPTLILKAVCLAAVTYCNFTISYSILNFVGKNPKIKCHAWISSYSVNRVGEKDNVQIFSLSRSA